MLLEKELSYLRNIFCKINNYPFKLVNDIIKKEIEKVNNVTNIENENNTENKDKVQILLPYAGTQGDNLINKMNKQLKKHLPQDIKVITTYQGTKLSSRFSVKDKVTFEHKHNLVYYGKCPEKECKDDYIGETDRRIRERIIDHNKRDKSSHLLRHAREHKHTHVWDNNFKILNSNYNSKIKRKISEFTVHKNNETIIKFKRILNKIESL